MAIVGTRSPRQARETPGPAKAGDTSPGTERARTPPQPLGRHRQGQPRKIETSGQPGRDIRIRGKHRGSNCDRRLQRFLTIRTLGPALGTHRLGTASCRLRDPPAPLSPKRKPLSLPVDRWFESISLQQPVCLSSEPCGYRRKASHFGGGLPLTCFEILALSSAS